MIRTTSGIATIPFDHWQNCWGGSKNSKICTHTSQGPKQVSRQNDSLVHSVFLSGQLLGLYQLDAMAYGLPLTTWCPYSIAYGYSGIMWSILGILVRETTSASDTRQCYVRNQFSYPFHQTHRVVYRSSSSIKCKFEARVESDRIRRELGARADRIFLRGVISGSKLQKAAFSSLRSSDSEFSPTSSGPPPNVSKDAQESSKLLELSDALLLL